MARSKVLPARRPRDEESLLVRSAESLGRIIGSLQRQLDGVTGRLSEPSELAIGSKPINGAATARARSTTTRTTVRAGTREVARKAAKRSKSGGTKARSTVDRKSKRAAKSAGAKKSAARQSGAGKTARKSTRHG